MRAGYNPDMRLCAALAALWFVFPLPAQILISSVEAEGDQRIPPAAIVRATGLSQGRTVSVTELDGAAQKLVDTGLLLSVTYRYEPVAGSQPPEYAIAFQVREDPADMPVRLEIPGMDEPPLWRALTAAEPLAGRAMPYNDRAISLYCRALERVLKAAGHEESIAAVQAADLDTGKMEVSLVPARPPVVSSVRFLGSRVIDGALLAEAVGRLVTGNRYSAREFRQVLLLNVQPLYEERGYLKVEFGDPRLEFSADRVAVTVTVAEGRPWTLGRVEITGEGVPADAMLKAGNFPEGRTANWRSILESVAEAEKVLAADGRMDAVSRAVRRFREDGRTVDVLIAVTPGKQYRFGRLEVSALGEFEARCRGRWTLNPGDPFNKLRAEDVLRDLLAQNIKARMQFKVQPDGTTIDVVYSLVP